MREAAGPAPSRPSLMAGRALPLGAAFLVVAALAGGWHLAGPPARKLQWLAFALAATFAIGGLIALRRAPVTAALVAALFLGGMAQLWFTEPDWFTGFYLHLRSPGDLAMAGALALEAGITGWALWRLVGRERLGALIASVGSGRLVLLVVVTGIASTPLLRQVAAHDPGGYALRLAVLGAISAMHIALVAAIVASPDLDRLWPHTDVVAALSRRAPLALAVLATGVAILLALADFRTAGLVEDEVAYLFQARTFAGGLLMAPPLPPGTDAAFRFYLLENTASGWYATTAPGFPAVLALGVLAGVPWLVNPLLGGLAVLLGHRFTERWSDRWTANLVALLMASSPWLLESSASLMTHALALDLILGGWLLVILAADHQAAGRRWMAAGAALVAGLLMGWLFVTRPLEGVLIGGLSGLWLAWTVRVPGWGAIALYGLGCLAAGALVFAYNAWFTGDPLVAPLAAYLDRLWGPHGNDFGFGPDIGPPTSWGGFDLWRGHSPLEGLINTIAGIRALNLEMLGWLPGSLLLVWAWLLWGRRGTLARLMAGVACAVIGIHFFYWFNSIFYIGPRYWYAAFLPLMIVSAFGAREVIGRLEAAGAADASRRVVTTICLLSLFGLVIFTSWRAIEKFAARSSAGSAIAAAARRPDMRDAVVFLERKAFASGAMLNDPFLRPGAPIFVRDRGIAENARTMAAFPGRHAIYLRLTNPTATRPRSE